MNRFDDNHARGSRGLLEDVVLKLVLTAAVVVAWVASFASLGGL